MINCIYISYKTHIYILYTHYDSGVHSLGTSFDSYRFSKKGVEVLQHWGQELVGFEGAAFRGDAQEALPWTCRTCHATAQELPTISRIFNGFPWFSTIFRDFWWFSSCSDFGAKVFRLLDDGAEIASSSEWQCFEPSQDFSWGLSGYHPFANATDVGHRLSRTWQWPWERFFSFTILSWRRKYSLPSWSLVEDTTLFITITFDND